MCTSRPLTRTALFDLIFPPLGSECFRSFFSLFPPWSACRIFLKCNTGGLSWRCTPFTYAPWALLHVHTFLLDDPSQIVSVTDPAFFFAVPLKLRPIPDVTDFPFPIKDVCDELHPSFPPFSTPRCLVHPSLPKHDSFQSLCGTTA